MNVLPCTVELYRWNPLSVYHKLGINRKLHVCTSLINGAVVASTDPGPIFTIAVSFIALQQSMHQGHCGEYVILNLQHIVYFMLKSVPLWYWKFKAVHVLKRVTVIDVVNLLRFGMTDICSCYAKSTFAYSEETETETERAHEIETRILSMLGTSFAWGTEDNMQH